MNCKNIKKIISAYIDGELDNSLEKKVSEHLRACGQCRAFKEKMISAAIMPVRTSERLEVPENLWRKIEENIAKKKESVTFAEFIKDIYTNIHSKKPALALATIMVTVLMSVLLLNGPFAARNAVEAYIRDKAEFFYYLSNEDADSELEAYGTNLGTNIEEYLL